MPRAISNVEIRTNISGIPTKVNSTMELPRTVRFPRMPYSSCTRICAVREIARLAGSPGMGISLGVW